MKPLTIDELKALQVGDWVWVVDKETPLHTGYYQIHGFAKTHIHFNREACIWVVPKALYGKDWIAYKNKEFAESNDEWVELPCKIGDTIYRLYKATKEIEEWEIKNIKLSKGETIFVCGHNGTEDYMVFGETEIGERFFTNKSEAKRRLAELKGE